jgi:hypothetical protein
VVREWYSSSKVYKPRKNPRMYSANINSGNRRNSVIMYTCVCIVCLCVCVSMWVWNNIQFRFIFIFVFFCRSFHATRLVKHERVGRRESVQPFGQDDRSGQLPSERQRERTVCQQRAHESIFLTCKQKKIRNNHETLRKTDRLGGCTNNTRSLVAGSFFIILYFFSAARLEIEFGAYNNAENYFMFSSHRFDFIDCNIRDTVGRKSITTICMCGRFYYNRLLSMRFYNDDFRFNIYTCQYENWLLVTAILMKCTANTYSKDTIKFIK